MVALVTKLAASSLTVADLAGSPQRGVQSRYDAPECLSAQQSGIKPLRGFTCPNVQRMFGDVKSVKTGSVCWTIGCCLSYFYMLKTLNGPITRHSDDDGGR
ncbi:Dolichyl-diphosphooligosaccharide--protein glycosyltransferase subunit STT3B [Liparis tanakae]|uniref:Dolichyl-diphosphooligosaccharide--protein glycosyltransferase subunit STT3B n=1 Tax=Liparis tanakae TaxID=230148 RepID=A0A4Z2FLE8_9TELE|nr:Dolichyl-diphosphooligosaccharide--protein glycosyltransferase subunit STT3B [Liparis tanakae]